MYGMLRTWSNLCFFLDFFTQIPKYLDVLLWFKYNKYPAFCSIELFKHFQGSQKLLIFHWKSTNLVKQKFHLREKKIPFISAVLLHFPFRTFYSRIQPHSHLHTFLFRKAWMNNFSSFTYFKVEHIQISHLKKIVEKFSYTRSRI